MPRAGFPAGKREHFAEIGDPSPSSTSFTRPSKCRLGLFDNSVRQRDLGFRLLPHPAVRTANPQSVAVDGKGLDVSFSSSLFLPGRPGNRLSRRYCRRRR